MKRKFLSVMLSMVMLITLLSGVCTVASATTVRNLSSEGFVLSSATPQELGRWDGYTGTVTDGANNSRIIAYSGSSTGSHISLYIPKSAVGSSAAPNILHLSYRIWNDRTNPATITHRMQYNSGVKDGFVTSESQFTMADDSSKNISTFGTSAYNYLDPYDYKIDLYENLKTGAYQIYLNGEKWISAYDYATPKNYLGSGSSSINEYRIRVTGATNTNWAFKLVNPCYELYSQDVLMDDIIAATASGMSNYLNATGPSDTARRMIDSKDGTITLNPPAYTDSESYSATGVSSGAKLIWWDGNASQGTGHKVKFKDADGGIASGKEWFHMGFNITGSNVGVQFYAKLWATQDKTSNPTKKRDWDILDAYTNSNYRVDFIFDLEHSMAYVYYNNVFSYDKNVDYVRQIDQLMLKITTNTNFTISNISFKYYEKGVSPGDIFAGYDSRSKTTYDYIYSKSGIDTTSTHTIGMMGGLCNISGNNSSGYTLAPGSINQNNGGFARYTLNYTEDTGIFQSSDDKVLLHTVYYTPSVVSSGSKHQIGIRGNDGYEWFLKAENGKFYTNSGEYIKPYSTSGTYRIDFMINNKDYKYYWLLDGVCFAGDTLGNGRRPLWEIAYTMWNTSDRMVLKNMQTTLYKSNKTLWTVAGPLFTRVFAKEESGSVSNGSVAITTSFVGPTTNAGGNTKILYAIYDSTGNLLKYEQAGSASGYINGSNKSNTLTIPTGGTTLKVFMWNLDAANNVLTPLSNVVTKSLQ